MSNNKKNKIWREKITAEISLVHVQEIAQEMGATFTTAEVAEFLNRGGLAQNLWTHMMQAGEQYIKSNLQCRVMNLTDEARIGTEPLMVQ